MGLYSVPDLHGEAVNAVLKVLQGKSVYAAGPWTGSYARGKKIVSLREMKAGDHLYMVNHQLHLDSLIRVLRVQASPDRPRAGIDYCYVDENLRRSSSSKGAQSHLWPFEIDVHSRRTTRGYDEALAGFVEIYRLKSAPRGIGKLRRKASNKIRRVV